MIRDREKPIGSITLTVNGSIYLDRRIVVEWMKMISRSITC